MKADAGCTFDLFSRMSGPCQLIAEFGVGTRHLPGFHNGDDFFFKLACRNA